MYSFILTLKKNVGFLTWIISLIIPFSYYSQTTFFKSFDQGPFGRPYLSVQTNDSNYVITGAGVSQISTELPSVIKLNAFGDSVWVKKVITPDSVAFGPGQFNPTSLIACNDSGAIYIDRNGYVIKIKQDGTLDWARKISINNSSISNIYCTSDYNNGFYFITGSTLNNVYDNKIIGHINNFGSVTQAYIVSNPSFYYGSMKLIDSDNLIITGSNYVMSFNFNSNSINWTKQFTELGFVNISKIGVNGDFILAGHTSVPGPDGDIFFPVVTRMDSNGNIIWSKRIGDNFSQYLQSIKETNDGGILIGGYTSNFSSIYHAEDFYSVKMDGNGNLIWSRVFGGESSDKIYGIEPTNSENYYVIGSTESYLCLPKTSFAKINPNILDCWYLGVNNFTQNFPLNPAPYTSQTQIVNNVNVSVASVTLADRSLGENLELCPLSCSELGVESVNKQQDFVLFPNPATNQIWVKGLNAESIQYSIYNSIGQLILQDEIQLDLSINIGGLQKGIYSIVVKDKFGLHKAIFVKE